MCICKPEDRRTELLVGRARTVSSIASFTTRQYDASNEDKAFIWKDLDSNWTCTCPFRAGLVLLGGHVMRWKLSGNDFRPLCVVHQHCHRHFGRENRWKSREGVAWTRESDLFPAQSSVFAVLSMRRRPSGASSLSHTHRVCPMEQTTLKCLYISSNYGPPCTYVCGHAVLLLRTSVCNCVRQSPFHPRCACVSRSYRRANRFQHRRGRRGDRRSQYTVSDDRVGCRIPIGCQLHERCSDTVIGQRPILSR